ncbi:zona pellucida sperm-binding protein 4-like [Gouania willdenowi]|uniref:zona pellucida sperm-binding protein 4-like n=1 Tax=Gouania willdenowi TaxID=441366 RepID=UPI00105438E7|nr:zona pellucida sperm-binding protein 4-like [Gouania willdenowi]
MVPLKYGFGVLMGIAVLLVGDIAAQSYLMPPLKKPQQSLQRNLQYSKLTPHEVPEKCQIGENEKIRCGIPDITVEQCEKINCCYDGHQCYYGKAVTVQCTRDGQFVVVLAREATVPPIDVNAISLLGSNEAFCSPVDSTSSFVIFQFPVTSCGTVLKDEGDFVVYENHMSSSYEVGIGPRGSITRDSHFELLFQCRYSGTGVEALVLDVNDLPPPIPVAAAGPLQVDLRLGSGQCHAKGCVEEEAAYNSFYSPVDYPITRVLREPVYVEVRLLERSDPGLILNLENCWSTSSPDPQSLPQWDLLIDGCPYHDDRYLTTLVPVDSSSGLQFPNHHKRFIMRMFSFVDASDYTPQKDTVFIHCSTSVCYPSSTDSCEQLCHRHRRAAATTVKKASFNSKALVSSGEVIYTGQKTSP